MLPDRAGLPRYARIADALILALLVLLVSVLVFGGFRVRAGDIRISVTSAWRLVAFVLIVASLRHAFVRVDPLPARVWRGMTRVMRRDAVRVALPIWVATRLGVLAVGYLSVVTIGYPRNAPPFRVSSNEMMNLGARWDAGWYMGIAVRGYDRATRPNRQQNVAFYPAFPVLMRAAGFLVGARTPVPLPAISPADLRRQFQAATMLGGLIVALGACLWGFVYLFRLAREDLEEPAARASVLLLATYPFAVFFSAPYTESLFLLATVAAFWHFRRREWLAAGAWGLLAGLTRPNGFLLAVPLGILALQFRWWPGARGARSASRPASEPATLVRPFAAAAMPVVGMLLFTAFLGIHTGRPLSWLDAHRAWGRTYQGLDAVLGSRVRTIVEGGLYEYTRGQPIEFLNAVAALSCLALAPFIARRLGLASAIFVVITVGPPLALGGFMSMGRVTSILFPVFLYLAAVLPPSSRNGMALVFALLQALCAALFFTWRPLF